MARRRRSTLGALGATMDGFFPEVAEDVLPTILKSVGFVHLHVHSAYSLREGALTIETLVKRAKADGMPALAITDANNLFGALEFSEKLAKEGIQPVIGAQITVDFEDAPVSGARTGEPRSRGPIVLLAQNEAGYA